MNSNQNNKLKRDYGAKAFIPLLVFLGIYLGAGIFFSVIGHEAPFKQIPRETALIIGLIVALFMGNEKLDTKIDIFAEAAGDPGVILMILIFLLSGSFATVAKEMGGVESTVNLGLTLVPKKFLFAGVFLISSFIATAMGTSMGTIAAIGPIAVGLAETAQINSGIAIAAVIGGAMFGDNLSIISDTTIAATRGVGAEMKDKFRMNFLIALPAALLAMVIYSFVGSSGEMTGDYSYSLIKILPYVFVLVTAIAGLNVIAVLLAGTIAAGVIGIMMGSMTVIGFAKAVTTGMAGMSSLVIISILIRGLTGLIKNNGGIEWITKKITSSIKNRKGAEYGVSGLVSILDGALANNTIAIIIAAPLSLEIAKKFNLAPKRVASLLDIWSCVIQGLVPHGGQILLGMELAGLSPFEILPYSYYPVLLGVATIITVQFGLMRTKEEKEGIDIYAERANV